MDIRKIIEENATFNINGSYLEMCIFNIRIGTEIDRNQNFSMLESYLIDYVCDNAKHEIIREYRENQLKKIGIGEPHQLLICKKI